MQIPIINKSPYPLPAYATSGSAGMDLYAHIDIPLTLQSLERYPVPTGLYIAIPEGYEAQVRPRSGLATRQGVTCLNSPGTIDSDYRGQIHVLLVNLSPEPQSIHPGDRIAQLVVQAVASVSWEPTEELPQTPRGSGGFGSTGKR